MSNDTDHSETLVASYLTLRKAVGVLGLSLPIVLALGTILIFGETEIRRTISDYYHSGMGSVFVAIICVIGAFLFSYKGYANSTFTRFEIIKDDLAGDLACLFAVGVALFPAAPGEGATEAEVIIGYVHGASAGLFFAMMAYFSLRLFTKSGLDKPGAKFRRNVYLACGWTILLGLVAFAVILLGKLEANPDFAKYKPVFVVETLMVEAFGLAWLVKGLEIRSHVADEKDAA